MAAVDALIRLITAQSADALLLATDQVPRLSRAGATQPLSMPPVGRAMMESFVAEVLTPEQMAQARTVESTVVEYGEFTATVKRAGEGWTMAFKKRTGARAADAASPRAAALAPPRPQAARESAPTPLTAAPAPAATAAPSIAMASLSSISPVRPLEARSVLLDRWLRRAIDEHATDLIISSGREARLRMPGGLLDLPGGHLDDVEIGALLEPFLAESHRDSLERHGSADFPLVWRDPDRSFAESGDRHRFRVNLFRQGGGLAAVLRPVRRDPPALSELHLPESLSRLARYPNGIVLVTGPAGAGKSTTMVALVEQLGRELPRHVITIEDPIEYEYRPQLALIHQREVGVHVDSFEAGLRAALRESPDLIVLGEMRDRPTMAAALTAAETGHLVLSSMHAGHAAMAIERVIDGFPEHQQRQVRGQLAGSLRAVLTQHLLPSTRAGARVPAIELLVGTPAVASLIRDGKTHQLASAIQIGRDDGMISLDRSLADLVDAGAVTYEAALAVTLDGGHQLRELLGRGGPRQGRPSR
jgi:twitching motility protein PilT